MDLLDVPLIMGGVNNSSGHLTENPDDNRGSFMNVRSVGVAGITRFSELKLDEEQEDRKEEKKDDYNPLSRTENPPRLEFSIPQVMPGSVECGSAEESKSPFSRSPTKKKGHGEYNDDAKHSFISGDYFASIVSDDNNMKASSEEEKKQPL